MTKVDGVAAGSAPERGVAAVRAGKKALIPQKAEPEKTVAASEDDDGRAHLGRVGAHLAKQPPDFDARNYGFARLSDLAEASGILDVEWVGDHPKIVTVRLKPGRS
ncbi:hypothetical protein FHX15_005484 [Rhizobium sp. BK650]|uniref:OST-HTH/LOTUS domain-containing protein n=1 Tax=Rhizobium sp. BK650 TaxID=2586990 RepID=UPI001607D0BE|nr:OST-HTH/LOTUS domain-containing protein [Rhizobium sp. BK650]MBB3660215.1 hypothetical protein [Rhizobium sp. BK650]